MMFTKRVKVGQADVYKEVINWGAVGAAIGAAIFLAIGLIALSAHG